MNAYAELARGKKVVALVASIDAGLSLLKVDPFSAQALEYVLAMTPAAYRLAASHAGVPMPSATTIAEVENVFRRRIEIRAALNSIPLRAVGR